MGYPIDWMIERKEYITIYYDDLNDFVREQFGLTEDEYAVEDEMDSGEIGTISVYKSNNGYDGFALQNFENYWRHKPHYQNTEAILVFLVNQDRIPEGRYMIWMD